MKVGDTFSAAVIGVAADGAHKANDTIRSYMRTDHMVERMVIPDIGKYQ